MVSLFPIVAKPEKVTPLLQPHAFHTNNLYSTPWRTCPKLPGVKSFLTAGRNANTYGLKPLPPDNEGLIHHGSERTKRMALGIQTS